MRISDWTSDVCSSDLLSQGRRHCRIGRLPLDHRRDRHVGLARPRAAARRNLWLGALGERPRNPQGWHARVRWRSEEHTAELQSLMRTSYAVLCLKKKTIYYSKIRTRSTPQSNHTLT